MKIFSFIHDNRYKIIKTLVTYLSYLLVGGAISLIGSSLLDLQVRVGTSYTTISYLIPVRSVGHIVGSALAGVLDRYFSPSCILFANNLISGISIGIAPNFTDLKFIAIFIFVAGTSHGILDVTCNTLLASTWKEKCANWLQVLHMCFGVGSFLTPIICRPFLLPPADESADKVQSNVTVNGSSNVPMGNSSDDVMVQNAFVIVAAFTVIMAIPFGCINLAERKVKKVLKDESKKSNDNELKQSYSSLKVYTPVLIVAGISHFIFSIESLVGTLGTSFTVKSDLHMKTKTGVLSSSVFWTCFSLYRLIFIPLTFIISQTKLLLFNLLISLAGFLILVPWANYYTTCVWTGFTLIGIGISPIFSAAYGMLAKYIFVTSKMSSMVFISGVLGESIHPAIAATILDKNPVAFLYYIGISGILFIILYLILLIYCAKVFKAPINLQHESVAKKSSIRSISRY